MEFLSNAKETVIRLFVDNDRSAADVDILTKLQKEDGLKELYAKIKQSEETETSYLMRWCKETGINYKSFKKWEVSKSHPALNLKQEKRIALKMRYENKYTCLRYISLSDQDDLSDVSVSGKIIQLFERAQSDGLLLEGAYDPSTITEYADPLRETFNVLKKAWEKYSINKSKSFDEQITISVEAKKILDQIQDYFTREPKLFIHVGLVSRIQYTKQIEEEFGDKSILYICISALKREREDVAPPDIGLEPNFDKLIRRN
tara:strand:- start:132 stop:911 length:780 start_codon:yes stop_codon:yes gene_type:complete